MLVPSRKLCKLKVWEERHGVQGGELRFKRALPNRWEVSDVSILGDASIHAAVVVAQHARPVHALQLQVYHASSTMLTPGKARGMHVQARGMQVQRTSAQSCRATSQANLHRPAQTYPAPSGVVGPQ